jgi:hypothetical protein
MPLTRHLYELDEVVSAAQTCLRNGWPRTPFWIWELVVSEETELARTTLLTSWLLYGGGYDPTVLVITDWLPLTLRVAQAIKAAHGCDAATMLTRTTALPVRPDVTPFPRNPSAARRRTERAATFVAALDPAEDLPRSDAAEWWISLDAACRQGSRTNAIWLLQAAAPLLSASGIWLALRAAARGELGPAIDALQTAVKDTPQPDIQILAQTNAVLLLCARGVEEREAMTRVPADLPIRFWQTEWDRWTAAIGRRATRIYSIPTDALHHETTRGSMSRRFTNIGDVREPLVVLVEGCTFWRNATANAGITEDEDTGAILFPTDEELEDFYDSHFPDDIPDEWSRADQEKSHGRGCAETAPPRPQPLIREEPVSQRVWHMAIGCRSKKLTGVAWRGGRC